MSNSSGTTAKVMNAVKPILIGLLLLLIVSLALSWLFNGTAGSNEPPAPMLLSQSIQGFFGYAGEETGIPTTLVLVSSGENFRILMASSGAEGENVVQAGRFSLSDGVMSLSAWDINGDEYMDVKVGTLILYGSPEGLKAW